MLRRFRAIGLAISLVVLLLLYGAAALLIAGTWTAVTTPSHEVVLTLNDVRIALLMSAGFMVLSGYVVTVVLLYVLYAHRQSPV